MFKLKKLVFIPIIAMVSTLVGFKVPTKADVNYNMNSAKLKDVAASKGSIISGHTYKIINKKSGKIVDVEGKSDDKGANVHQWEWKNGNHQKWQLEHISDGYYKVINVHSGKVMDVEGVSKDNGANIHQWNWKNGEHQKWILEDVSLGTGVYKIVNNNSGHVLDVSRASKDNGANVLQWPWADENNQKWYIDTLEDGYCKLTSVNSNKVLEAAENSKDDGGNVRQWEWSGGDNQRWKKIDNSDGTYRFENKNSGKVFDVEGKSGDKGANVHQWNWNNKDHQKWHIIEVAVDDQDNCNNVKLNNVIDAFDKLSTEGKVYNVSSYLPMNGDMIHNHCQGIARYKDQVFVSQNVTSNVDIYSISEASQINKRINFDTKYGHYSGCQVIGNYLVTSAEGDSDSDICFYNINTSREITRLKIARRGRSAGGVGITNFKKGDKECYLLAVLHDGKVDFYTADSPLNSEACQFKLICSDININAIKGFSDYSQLCLVTDEKDKVYIMGFRSTMTGNSALGISYPKDDYIDLYSLDNIEENNVKCNYVKSKHVITHGDPSGATGPHFRYTGGLDIVSSTEINVMTSSRLPTSSSYNINVFSTGSGF